MQSVEMVEEQEGTEEQTERETERESASTKLSVFVTEYYRPLLFKHC